MNKSTIKRTATLVSLLLLLAVSGLGFAYANHSPTRSAAARITGGGAFDRTFEVSAFSAIIDSDGDATIIHSDANQLRFEKTRLLIDGYVAAELTTNMRDFAVAFTDNGIVVTADDNVLIKRTRENPRLAGLVRF